MPFRILLSLSLVGSKYFPENTILIHHSTMKRLIFWDTTVCSPLKVNVPFRSKKPEFCLLAVSCLAYSSTLNVESTSAPERWLTSNGIHGVIFQELNSSWAPPWETQILQFYYVRPTRHRFPKCGMRLIARGNIETLARGNALNFGGSCIKN
jgi:hypothetical protein